jgi:hypothetical protein
MGHFELVRKCRSIGVAAPNELVDGVEKKIAMGPPAQSIIGCPVKGGTTVHA